MSKISKKKKILIAIIGIITIGLLGGALYLRHKKNKNTDTTTKSQNPSENTKSTYPTSGSSNSSNNANGSSSSKGSITPAKPSGQLLNKHNISLSSTVIESNPDMDSVCITSPNASCDLKLTGPDNSIKYVGVKNVGSSGAVDFMWNAKNIGLVAGKWKIEAIATIGDANSTSSPDYLQVNP